MVGDAKELEITINVDGTVRAVTRGVKGPSCVDLVKFLEESLGGSCDSKLKPEYYERDGYLTDSVRTDG